MDAPRRGPAQAASECALHHLLWGDAVNTASRMESHGTPGHIQITEATYKLIKDEFECEPRGTVTIKGKGEMETWYLLGRHWSEVGEHAVIGAA
jgi:class 3 adenylate cyclase